MLYTMKQIVFCPEVNDPTVNWWYGN